MSVGPEGSTGTHGHHGEGLIVTCHRCPNWPSLTAWVRRVGQCSAHDLCCVAAGRSEVSETLETGGIQVGLPSLPCQGS